MYNGLKVLSSYHRKGGVGKTFLASTIAYLLANGGVDGSGIKRRVLILDFDAQQDSSKAFLHMRPIPGDDEYAAPMHPEYDPETAGEWSGFNSSTDLLFDVTVMEYPTAFPNIKILPSEGNVDRVLGLSDDSTLLVEAITQYMKDWFSLDDVSADFDIVIIDNPPSKSPVSSGILAAATHVIIPTEPEYDSIDGAPNLLNRINLINKDREDSPLEVAAIMPNKVPTSSKMTQKDKIAMAKLYAKDGPTRKFMPNFWITRRDCYRVFDRPSVDPKHFDYVRNRYAIEEMAKLHRHMEKQLWGSE